MNTIKRYQFLILPLLAVILTACGLERRTVGPDGGTPTVVLEPAATATPTPQPTDAPPEPTVAPPVGASCQSESLRVAVTLPDDQWRCDPDSEGWLAISSPIFEIQMSALGRGYFCTFPDDASCGRAPFYSNDVVELELWSASGVPQEIFGFTTYERAGANLWIAIKYQDMQTRTLDPGEQTELVQLLDSLREFGAPGAQPPSGTKPVLATHGPSRVRTGPGLHYADYYFLSGGTTLPILGRNAEGGWWAVPGPGDGPGPYGWISATIVTVQGDATNVPVLPATPVPPTPWPGTGLPILGRADAPAVDRCVVYQSGQVRDEELPYVYSGPGKGHGLLGQLGRNRWAEATRRQDGWYEVSLAPAETGWVNSAEVAVNGLCPTPGSGPVRIEFAPGTASATLIGQVIVGGPSEFLLWAAAGQRMTVHVSSPDDGVRLQVEGVDDGQVYKQLLDGAFSWEGVLPLPQDYRVTLDAGEEGEIATYTLDVSIVNLPTQEPDAPIIINPGEPPTTACVAFHPGSGTDTITVHLGPGEQFAVVARLGNWAEVLQSTSNWHHILIGPGETGWVKDAAVMLAGPCALPEPAPVRIQFPPGDSSTTLEGMLEPSQRDYYLFRASAGQRTTIEIVSEFNRANFGLSGIDDGQPYKRVENEERVWSIVLPQTQDYLLTVAAPAGAPTTGYRIFLTIEPLATPTPQTP